MPNIVMERSGELEVFLRVVDEGGFSAAARSLNLTPSGVSKLIGRLESRLGSRLFVRTTRSLALTQEGEAYRRAGMKIVSALNDAEQSMGPQVKGHLRVSASIPFGRMYVAPTIASFLERHPAVSVELALSDDLVDLVKQKADVAVRMGPLASSSLVAKKLAYTKRVVCASPAYLALHGTPKTPSDLDVHQCLTFSFKQASTGWPFRDGTRIVSGRLQVNNGETMRQMTIAAAGISRLGLFHVAPDFAAGTLVPILEDWNPGDVEDIHAVHVGGALPRRVRAFIDHLASELRAQFR